MRVWRGSGEEDGIDDFVVESDDLTRDGERGEGGDDDVLVVVDGNGRIRVGVVAARAFSKERGGWGWRLTIRRLIHARPRPPLRPRVPARRRLVSPGEHPIT